MDLILVVVLCAALLAALFVAMIRREGRLLREDNRMQHALSRHALFDMIETLATVHDAACAANAATHAANTSADRNAATAPEGTPAVRARALARGMGGPVTEADIAQALKAAREEGTRALTAERGEGERSSLYVPAFTPGEDEQDVTKVQPRPRPLRAVPSPPEDEQDRATLPMSKRDSDKPPKPRA